MGSKEKVRRAVSPSGVNAYLSCQRKFWHKYINKTEPESVDTEALDIGKSIHKVLEDRNHDLSGLKYSEVVKASESFGVDQRWNLMLFAMLSSYKKMHGQSGMDVLACELEIDAKNLYGFVDAVGKDDYGTWIIDIKTAASYSKMLAPTLSRHIQLTCYAMYAKSLCESLDLDPDSFQGIRYRCITKSKLKQSDREPAERYLARLKASVESFDLPVKVSEMDIPEVKNIVLRINSVYRETKDERPELVKKEYLCNFNNCTQYFRACEYYSSCYGKSFSGG